MNQEDHRHGIKQQDETKTEPTKAVDAAENSDGGAEVEIPDGGWGWLIVLASFMCNAIVDGIIFSYGLFIPQFAEEFGETKGRLAWIGSITAGCYLIIGPVASGFANAYGCRMATITGTLLSAASLALSSFATSMSYLCISFGLICGIGFGFIYLPAVVTVGFYFERKRAFATGLAVCGSGVGTFVMAPLVKYLLEEYSWQGSLLILSGIVLHCAVFGALFKPLTPKPKKQVKVPLLQRIKEYRDANKTKWISQDYLETSQRNDSVTNRSETEGSYLETCEASCSNNTPPPSYSEVVDENERLTFLHCARQEPGFNKNCASHLVKEKRSSLNKLPQMRPFYRQDILYSASVLNLPECCSQKNLESYRKSITKIPTLPEPPERSSNCCFSPVMKDTFRQMLDFSLMKSPTFLVLCLAGSVTLAGFFVPFMFVVDRAVTAGISIEQATYILPAIGFTNTVGRVFSGWVSDRQNLNALTINNVALIIGGACTIISPFLNSFSLLMTYGAIFGFSIACFATLRSIIVVELLGLDKLTNAFGLLLLFQGIAAILGGPIAGLSYDMTGSYDASFCISGSFILISGLLGIPLRAISRWEKKREERRTSDPSSSNQEDNIGEDTEQRRNTKPSEV